MTDLFTQIYQWSPSCINCIIDLSPIRVYLYIDQFIDLFGTIWEWMADTGSLYPQTFHCGLPENKNFAPHSREILIRKLTVVTIRLSAGLLVGWGVGRPNPQRLPISVVYGSQRLTLSYQQQQPVFRIPPSSTMSREQGRPLLYRWRSNFPAAPNISPTADIVPSSGFNPQSSLLKSPRSPIIQSGSSLSGRSWHCCVWRVPVRSSVERPLIRIHDVLGLDYVLCIFGKNTT